MHHASFYAHSRSAGLGIESTGGWVLVALMVVLGVGAWLVGVGLNQIARHLTESIRTELGIVPEVARSVAAAGGWLFPWGLSAHALWLMLHLPLSHAVVLTGFLGLLATLALVDARTGILPNELTLPLLLGGLAWQGGLAGGIPTADALWGVLLGYAAARAVNAVGRCLMGADVLGQGDAKLLAGLGAWLGLGALPAVWVIASLLLVVYTACRRLSRRARVPLGPFLAAGADLMVTVKTCSSWV